MNEPVDYSHEVKPSKSAWQRGLLIFLGTFFLVLAVLGIFLPLLPTTPFLLLSAACYARGSVKFYNALMNHRIIGSYIHDWRTNKGVPIKAKVLAISLIVVTFSYSSTYISVLWGKTVFLGIGTLVILYILRLPTKKTH